MNNPQVTITLDHMRQQMIHAFTNYSNQMQEQFEKALDEAIKNFDYVGEIKAIAHCEIQKQMKGAFEDVFWKLRRDDEFRQKIYETVKQSMAPHDLQI